MSPRVFGKYEIVRRLAVGGMGEIFLSRQVGPAGFDRYVILKALLPDLAESGEAVARFLDEARLAATLNHPNIVSVHEVGQWEGTYFIVMEYIHGDNLARIVAAAKQVNRNVPFEVGARIVYDAALALDHAHQRTMVHRDVSRENIMVRLDGVTKVVDFGIAKAADTSHRTRTGVLQGKLRYLPPEAFKTRRVDALGDQFSLGVVWWELLTGERMFDPKLDTASRIEGIGIEAPSDLADDIPPELEDVVLQMLALDPADRFSNCGAVAERIADHLGDRVGNRGVEVVATFVRAVAAERIERRTKEPEHSGESFLVPLPGLPPVPQTETVVLGSGEADAPAQTAPSPTRSWPWFAAVAAVVTIVGWTMWPRASSRAPRPTNTIVAPSLDLHPPPAPPVEAPARIIHPATLTVTSTPAGATVFAGNTVLGLTPLTTTSLAPSTPHALRLERRGFHTKRLTVSIRPGTARQVSVALARRKVKATPPAAPARISVRTEPWTRVTLDGRPFGTTPLFEVTVPAGQHRLRFVNEAAGVDEIRVIDAKRGVVTKLDYDLKR